ncbi:MAG: GNAT family N-acetyltransferase [Acidobacteria bacterium]|nr:GNAT family N-acetyltransferase [Acidobacteriota bacterium]
MKIEPGTLEGRYVRLEPLKLAHVPGLAEVGLDPELWRWTTTELRTVEDMRTYVESALELQAQRKACPFATVERVSGRVIGSTRFANIAMEDRHVEIGWTWVTRPWQRTAINTEAKYLMLRHAFETWKCIRVELKTDALNVRSRAAILRIGAKEEGIFRNHMITRTGRIRDTVYFSIIDSEWPGVKQRLEGKLGL